jgi:hypothetical protein
MSETKPGETKPKKMVGRSVAIALGIACIILIAGIGGAMAYYTMAINKKNSTVTQLNQQMTNKDSQISSLNSQVAQLQEWLDGNKTEYDSYVNSHSHTNSEYDSNLANYFVLRAPHLVSDLSLNDIPGTGWPYYNSPYIHIWGDIVNIGADTAVNSSLFVELKDASGNLILNKTLSLGDFAYGSFVWVDKTFDYNGGAAAEHIYSQPYGIDWTFYQ